MKIADILNIDTLIRLHDLIITEFGGAKGIQNQAVLLSSLANPFQTFHGQELYPTHIEKAGIVFYSLIRSHGFVDGNKRTACLMLALILRVYGYQLKVDNLIMEKKTLEIANKKIDKEDIFLWLYHNIDYLTSK